MVTVNWFSPEVGATGNLYTATIDDSPSKGAIHHPRNGPWTAWLGDEKLGTFQTCREAKKVVETALLEAHKARQQNALPASPPEGPGYLTQDDWTRAVVSGDVGIMVTIGDRVNARLSIGDFVKMLETYKEMHG